VDGNLDPVRAKALAFLGQLYEENEVGKLELVLFEYALEYVMRISAWQTRVVLVRARAPARLTTRRRRPTSPSRCSRRRSRASPSPSVACVAEAAGSRSLEARRRGIGAPRSAPAAPASSACAACAPRGRGADGRREGPRAQPRLPGGNVAA
jgi:hypothetical protein